MRRIGWVYAGSPGFQFDHIRSTTREQWAPLWDVPGVEWVELQVGRGGTFTPASWCETEDVLRTLDLVIAVDTSTAHLAGAMGIPTWVLLPYAVEWRWGESGETTPWYPHHRLFRQAAPGDWDGVFRRVKAALLSGK